MRKVSLSEAEHHFGSLVKEVEGGETIELSRDGKVVARVVPAGATIDTRQRTAERQAEIERAIAEIKAIRERGVPVTSDEIRAWIKEGRM